jgi:hypothetical protein
MDPRQLPPVPDPYVGDDGRYCFESDLWTQLFPHKITLKNNYRQTEPMLAHLVEECFTGTVSPEYESFGKQLSRPLEPHVLKTATYLFGNNHDCTVLNAQRLRELEGECQVFTAEDEGDVAKIDINRVPTKLALKVSQH